MKKSPLHGATNKEHYRKCFCDKFIHYTEKHSKLLQLVIKVHASIERAIV